MPVIDRAACCINLNDQGGALTSSVLGSCRKALYHNDYYTSLVISNNKLDDECIAVLCALLKEKNALHTLDFQNCSLDDKFVSFYLVSALLVQKRIRRLNFSRNPCITEASTAALVELIQESGLLELRLMGTNLGQAGGKKILKAIENSTEIEICELPFNVGFDVLDRIAVILQRNINNKRGGFLAEKKFIPTERGSSSSYHGNRDGLQKSLSPNHYGKAGDACERLKSAVDKNDVMLEAGAALDSTSRRSRRHHSNSRSGLPDFGRRSGRLGTNHAAPAIGSLESATLKNWVDPTINRSLAHLHVLESRSKLQRQYYNRQRSRMRRLIGLSPEPVSH